MKRFKFKKALKILLATNSLILLAGALLGPIYALFVKEIGGSLLDASIAGALFAFAAGVTTLLSGKLSDSIKENELIIVFGYAMLGTGFFLYTLVNTIYFLFAVQILIGLSEAIFWPAFDSLYTKHMDGYASGRQWGAWESMAYFTTGFGALAGGIIVTKFGFNPLFLLMAALCFGSAIYIYLLPRKAL